METARRFDVFRFWETLDSRLSGAVTVGARERFAAIEDWHIVGEPGEPRFRSYPSSAFPSYRDVPTTGPIIYEHGAAPVSFFRDTSGMVHLRGELVRVEQGRNNHDTPLYPPFALPPGYRPPGGLTSFFSVAGSIPSRRLDQSGPSQPGVDIGQAGISPPDWRGLLRISNLPAGASVFLDGIRFLAAPVNRERYITDGDRPPPGY
jgi:hypothetical protein